MSHQKRQPARHAAGALIAAATLGGLSVAATAATPPDAVIYAGGPIVTMEGPTPGVVEAIAVRGGRILAVGGLAEVSRQAGPRARKVDLKGATLLPGFIDAHGHVSDVGQAAGLAQLAAPPVGRITSIAALQDVLRAYIAERHIPPGGLVVGVGYDDSQLAEHRHPNRQDLDAVAADRVIVVSHASGHFAALNSLTLAKLGLDAGTPNPSGGVIRREADGRTPDGVLEEAALAPLLRMVQPSSPEAGVAALVAGERIYAAHGITTAQDGRQSPAAYAAAMAAAARGVLPLDTVGLIAFEADWPEDVTRRIGAPYEGRFRVAGVKLVLDGSPQGRTAWLHEPVTVPPAGRDASYAGYPLLKPDVLQARLALAAHNHWQVFAHVNGDEAMQALIDGVRAQGLAGHRTIAIHAQVVRPEQLDQMKALDIQPSFFASHTWYWGDWHRDVALGPKRADFISPQRSAERVGLIASAHNDSPVTPPDMVRLIWSSITRRSQSGDILGPLERVSPYQALKQVTINAAWQIHEEADKGSLAPGKRADLVVLGHNPLTARPEAWLETRVVATIKDGTVIFGALD